MPATQTNGLGTVLLLPEFANQPQLFSNKLPSDDPENQEKRTSEGILLSPSPDESPNDPLNWPLWRRNIALLALGIYCMLGGGMTPLLAAGFHEVAQTFHVGVPKVALTTGFFMLGLGIGSVFVMPTAILFGKRLLYLTTAVVFFVASIWCAVSPSYTSLVLARIFQGIAVSPVECLP
jgi:Na+/melibiose symporter-like transporter